MELKGRPDNYNRLIDVELFGESGGFSIKTPEHGRKPSIDIEGTLTGQDSLSGFTIRIKNFYTTQNISDFQTVRIKAGYQGNKSVAFEGSITAIYNEGPGPDRVTVICCAAGNFKEWMDTVVDIHLQEGWTLQDAAKELTESLGFLQADVSPEITGQIPAAWDFTGGAKDALHQMRSYFPGVSVTVMNNRIVAVQAGKYRKTVTLSHLCTIPNISGNGVSIVAPWNPQLQPNDLVEFPANYYSTNVTAALSDGIKAGKKQRMVAESIAFSFGTTGTENQMVVTGIIEGGTN